MRPHREREGTGIRWYSFTPRSAMLVPRPAGWLLTRHARHHRALHAAKTVVRVSAALALLSLLFVHVQAAMAVQVPPVPSDEQICGSSILNGGPSSPPGGATTVPAGDNSAMFQYQMPDNTTYWFAPGTHTLGSSQYSQIQSGNGDTFIGAPGAVINGQGLNDFAISAASDVSGVTVEYLTIEDFIPSGTQGALNVNGTPDWTIEYDTIQDNIPGTGVGLGTGNVLSYNCITGNGEYAFNAYSITDVSSLTSGPSNITMTYNEISYNDVCNYENMPNFPISVPSGCPTPSGAANSCGCTGGGKFWAVDGAVVDDNYVHNNYSVGLWADTDNAGFDFSNNYLADNFSEGIIYEISYNAQFTGNVFTGNGIGLGESGAVSGFPLPSLYISESGSDSRVSTPYDTTFAITGNQFYGNWGGVTLWENADRYCSSVADTSAGYCTLVNNLWSATFPVDDPPVYCATDGGDIQNTPYINDCRWKTQNVQVTGNLFDFTPGTIGAACTTGNFCGFNGLISEAGSVYPFNSSGVGADYVENNITFNQGNLFSGNTYCGPWNFDALAQGNTYNWAQWTSSPYDQDPGSTLNGSACNTVQFPIWGGPVNRTITIPIRIGRR